MTSRVEKDSKACEYCHNEPEFELPWSNDTARQLKLSVRILVPTSLAATLQGRCGQTLQDRGGVHRHSFLGKTSTYAYSIYDIYVYMAS